MILHPEPHGHDACVGAHVAAQELLMQVVSAGLGGKLFLEAVPELSTMMNSMDRLLEVGVHDPMFIARAWLLLRGIHGARGVRWLADWLEEHTRYGLVGGAFPLFPFCFRRIVAPMRLALGTGHVTMKVDMRVCLGATSSLHSVPMQALLVSQKPSALSQPPFTAVRARTRR